MKINLCNCNEEIDLDYQDQEPQSRYGTLFFVEEKTGKVALEKSAIECKR